MKKISFIIPVKNGEKYIDCSDIKNNDGQGIPFDISMGKNILKDV